MFEKLELVEKRYDELNSQISDPEVIANTNEWRKLVKEHSSMEDVVQKYREYKEILNNIHIIHLYNRHLKDRLLLIYFLFPLIY
mgnify:CR=1 FL=1